MVCGFPFLVPALNHSAYWWVNNPRFSSLRFKVVLWKPKNIFLRVFLSKYTNVNFLSTHYANLFIRNFLIHNTENETSGCTGYQFASLFRTFFLRMKSFYWCGGVIESHGCGGDWSWHRFWDFQGQTISLSLRLVSKQPPTRSWEALNVVRGSSHLIGFPVSEEVDGAVHPPLDHGPAAWVVPLVAPHLHEPIGVLWLDQVHAAGRVAVLQSLQTILKWTWREHKKSELSKWS